MAQPKGHTGNPNGRPKGKPNKVTQEIRVWLASVIDKNRRQIESDLKALEPKERLLILEKLMQYVIPKNTRNENTEERQTTITFDEYIKLLNGEQL